MTILDDIEQAYRESRYFWGAQDSCWDDAIAVEQVTGGGVMRVYNIIRSTIEYEPDSTPNDVAVEVAAQLKLVTLDEASNWAGREVVA